MSPTGAKTMAEIIQMEQKFKEQYHKLTNRNMDLIQLEEKAIEDLKVLYNVHNSFDMQITIDFENDKDYDVLSTCAPIWKKVRIWTAIFSFYFKTKLFNILRKNKTSRKQTIGCNFDWL